MNALLDLIIIAIFIVIVVISAKRGLVKSLLGLFCVIVAFLVAQNFCNPLGDYFEEKCFGPMFADQVAVQLGSVTNEQSTTEELLNGSSFSKLFEDAPEALDGILASWGTDMETIGEQIISAGNSAETAINEFIANTVTKGAAHAISISAAFIVLFLAAFALCTLAVVIVDAICKLPVLKTLNKVGGALFGIVKGGIVAILVTAIICFASPYISHNGERVITDDAINATMVFKYLTPQSLFAEKSPSDIYNSLFHADSTDTPSPAPQSEQ